MIHTYQNKLLALYFALALFVQVRETLKGEVLEVLDGKETQLILTSFYTLSENRFPDISLSPVACQPR